jgi:hypothetical protein
MHAICSAHPILLTLITLVISVYNTYYETPHRAIPSVFLFIPFPYSKYSPRHSFLKHSQSISRTLGFKTKCHTDVKQQIKLCLYTLYFNG